MNYYNGFSYQQGEPAYVQGEAGAQAFYVAPGKDAILMDSELPRFYYKKVDWSGRPFPLKTFEFKELTVAPPASDPKYVTHEEFDKFVASLKAPEQEAKNE